MQDLQETQVWFLGLEDPLEEEMATLSSILAWETPWIEEPGGLQSMESQRVRQDWATEHNISCPVKHLECYQGEVQMSGTKLKMPQGVDF